jgi:RNA-directed DNA polymerase
MILEPIWEADFSRHSYGFRPNRSTKDAVAYLGARLTGYSSQHYGWIVEGDIQSFLDRASCCLLQTLTSKDTTHSRERSQYRT